MPDIYLNVTCTICGLRIIDYETCDRIDGQCPPRWFPDTWLARSVLLLGPHWPSHKEGPKSFKIPDTAITRHSAERSRVWHKRKMMILPDGPDVFPQLEEDVDEQHRYEPHASQKWYFGIHTACEELAIRAMRTSQECKVRSTGDLWMTLDRRCTKSIQGRTRCRFCFIPEIPNKLGGEIKLDHRRYFLPQDVVFQTEDDWLGEEAWWKFDPITIPDLTADLMPNLQLAPRRSNSLTRFERRFVDLPQEIKEEIILSVLKGSIPRSCNYVLPQSFWKQLFLRIPFLWDLDSDFIDRKSRSSSSGKRDWDWEKLSRQILSSPIVPVGPWEQDSYSGDQYENPWEQQRNRWEAPWGCAQVGLTVPAGLINRRRIWQIVEEMYPSDVGMRHLKDDVPRNQGSNVYPIST
ncbi:hypothetical protein FDECE_9665 [Fusarium decemcellulare]|nr:hypothetical protein FDECE_9665 [Fusarium decemcellulare]